MKGSPAVHELALFWRDLQARSFTSFHFFARKKPAAKLAAQMVNTLQQFSNLQLYGAALDGERVDFDLAKSPPPSGSEVRFQLNLYPAEAINPLQRITRIKFSIPGPVQDLIATLTKDRIDVNNPAWQLLEESILSYLCLPNGTPINPAPGPARIQRAEILQLSEDKRPQPDQPPVEDAIARTQEDLDGAKANISRLRSRNQEPSQRDLQRVTKYQDRLAGLLTLREIEKSLFDSAKALDLPLPEQIPAPQTKAIVNVGEAAAIFQPIKEKEIMDNRKATSTPSSGQPSSQDTLYLPARPEPDSEAAPIWADVPETAFADPSLWLHRSLLKQQHDISERSYYRWIDSLKKHGLARSLPAKQDAKVTLFYRPDVKRTLASMEPTGKPQADRPTIESSHPTTATSSAPQPATSRLAVQQPTPLASSDLQLIKQHGADISALKEQVTKMSHQQDLLNQSINSLSSKADQISNQLSLLSQAPAQSFAQALEVISQSLSIKEILSQLQTSISKLNSQIHHLPARIAAETAKPVTKAKSKASKAKVKAKAKAKSKTKTKSSSKFVR